MKKIRPGGDVITIRKAHLYSEERGITPTLRNGFLSSYQNKIDAELTRTQS